ncbi:MAG: phage tail tube protein [Chromatiaceae bacterium]|nr:phage tail tube protein [Candidatus Thioaporhodococcus sediminis]
MAGCPAFGSTSETSLFYAIDPDPAAAIPDVTTWFEVPFTGESLNATLSSTISERITPQRSYAGSLLTQGEAGGDINFELQASPFMNNMLIAALQANQALDVGADEVAGTSGVTINAVQAGINDDRTIDVTGLTVTVGASYSVVIDGENFTHVAVTGNTLANIATELAALIDASSAYAATASTNVITIASGAGLSVITFTSWVPTAWAPGEALTNGSTKKCLMFLKRVKVSDTEHDLFAFRGCQVSSLSLAITPGALITGTVSLMGVKPDDPVEAVVVSTIYPTWTFTSAPELPLMSGVSSLETLEIRNSAGVDTGVTLQDFNLTLDNQLRQQQAVGLGHVFSAGIASGRFMAQVSGTAYYASPKIYDDFLNDRPLKVIGELRDSEGNGWDLLFDLVKVTSGSLPEAGGPDQDLTVATEMQAYESLANGTVKITRVAE